MNPAPVRSHSVLSFQQVQRLVGVMKEPFEVHGDGNFPTLYIRLQDLIREVSRRISEKNLALLHVKINGGLASHILASTHLPFNDIDLIFGVSLGSGGENFEIIKRAVLDSLLEFLPIGAQKSRLSHTALKDAYVRKMVKVTDNDLWSLIALNNNYGRFIELKFVDRMRRQFEFSVDSFQIQLDSLMTFFNNIPQISTQPSLPKPLPRGLKTPTSPRSPAAVVKGSSRRSKNGPASCVIPRLMRRRTTSSSTNEQGVGKIKNYRSSNRGRKQLARATSVSEDANWQGYSETDVDVSKIDNRSTDSTILAANDVNECPLSSNHLQAVMSTESLKSSADMETPGGLSTVPSLFPCYEMFGFNTKPKPLFQRPRSRSSSELLASSPDSAMMINDFEDRDVDVDLFDHQCSFEPEEKDEEEEEDPILILVLSDSESTVDSGHGDSDLEVSEADNDYEDENGGPKVRNSTSAKGFGETAGKNKKTPKKVSVSANRLRQMSLKRCTSNNNGDLVDATASTSGASGGGRTKQTASRSNSDGKLTSNSARAGFNGKSDRNIDGGNGTNCSSTHSLLSPDDCSTISDIPESPSSSKLSLSSASSTVGFIEPRKNYLSINSKISENIIGDNRSHSTEIDLQTLASSIESENDNDIQTLSIKLANTTLMASTDSTTGPTDQNVPTLDDATAPSVGAKKEILSNQFSKFSFDSNSCASELLDRKVLPNLNSSGQFSTSSTLPVGTLIPKRKIGGGKKPANFELPLEMHDASPDCAEESASLKSLFPLPTQSCPKMDESKPDPEHPGALSFGGSVSSGHRIRSPTVRISPEFFPSVTAESLFGDFDTALWHLDEGLIDTKRPEEIRGGGLLKYCNLLVRGYRAASGRQIRNFERYMCSRFFIDFSSVSAQHAKLQAYLDNHFFGDPALKYEYLVILYKIVSQSTVCLMHHERRTTLEMIENLSYQVSMEMSSAAVTVAAAATASLQMSQYSEGMSFDAAPYPVFMGSGTYCAELSTTGAPQGGAVIYGSGVSPSSQLPLSNEKQTEGAIQSCPISSTFYESQDHYQQQQKHWVENGGYFPPPRGSDPPTTGMVPQLNAQSPMMPLCNSRQRQHHQQAYQQHHRRGYLSYNPQQPQSQELASSQTLTSNLRGEHPTDTNRFASGMPGTNHDGRYQNRSEQVGSAGGLGSLNKAKYSNKKGVARQNDDGSQRYNRNNKKFNNNSTKNPNYKNAPTSSGNVAQAVEQQGLLNNQDLNYCATKLQLQHHQDQSFQPFSQQPHQMLQAQPHVPRQTVLYMSNAGSYWFPLYAGAVQGNCNYPASPEQQ